MKYKKEESFIYENGFYLTSDYSRTSRLLAHYEIYKLIQNIKGDIVECGVFKGASLMRFINFIQIFEQKEVYKRQVYGFDVFDMFPGTAYENDQKELESFISETGGGISIAKEDLDTHILQKGFDAFELIKGDIAETVPSFVKSHSSAQIALLNIDTDIYEPCKVILQNLAPLVVSGGIIIFDDYNVFEGETKLADEYCQENGFKLRKFDFSKVPYFLIKD